MNVVVDKSEKATLNHFCEFIKTLTQKEQETMLAFVQGMNFGRNLDNQSQHSNLKPTG